MTPYFSIIIPVYNLKNYLMDCLDSIINQSFKNFEVIVVDDGSTDGSSNICDNYSIYDNFKIYHTENKGVSSARNIGLLNANGEYIVFVDGDDIVKSNYLECFYNMLNSADSIDLAICGIEKEEKSYVMSGSQELNGIMDRKMILEHCLSYGSIGGFLVNKAYKRTVITDNSIFLNTEIFVCEDLLFNIEFVLNIENGIFKNEDTYVYMTRIGSALKSGFSCKKMTALKAYDFIIKNFCKYNYRNLIKKAKCNLLVICSDYLIKIRLSEYNKHKKDYYICKNVYKDNLTYFLKGKYMLKDYIKIIFAFFL